MSSVLRTEAQSYSLILYFLLFFFSSFVLILMFFIYLGFSLLESVSGLLVRSILFVSPPRARCFSYSATFGRLCFKSGLVLDFYGFIWSLELVCQSPPKIML